MQRRCSGALARRLYHHLTRAAAEDPDLANRLYLPLSFEAGKCLDSATLDRLDVDFLAAILPEIEDAWDRYAGVIRRVALAADPTTVIKMLDIYRRASNPSLKNYVAGQFFERLEAAPESLTEQEMIDGIRKSLGVASRDHDNRRWQLLAASAEELLGRKRVERTNPDVLLQETIELAHAATLACALAQGEAGGPQFDELQTKGAVKLDIRSGPWNTTRAKMFDSPYPVTGRTVLRNSIHSLATSRLAAQRTDLLRMIASQTVSVPDLDLPSGLSLAAYLVQFKPDEQEHLQMLRFAPQVANWNAVRLGLADQLLDVPGRDTQLEQLFAAILAGEAELNTEAGRASVRRRLLTQVLAGLAAKPDTDDPHLRVFDEGSNALRDLYAIQARTMSIPPDDYSAAGQPSDVLAALIRYWGGLLSTTKLEAADRALVDELPYRLKAVDFAAANDLQYTVALQRIWLQLVALHVAQQRPEKAGAVREIRAESGEPVPGGENVFEQLRNLHIGLLRVWLLLRPPTDETELPDVDVRRNGLMRRLTILVFILFLMITNLAIEPVLAVIVFLKGQDEPIRGYFVRENEHVVVLQQLQTDGSTQERIVSRSEIEDVIKTVDSARLEALRPENPDGYREYAEELAEKSKDPDAQVTAIRLFLIAAYLQPQRLGRSCLLGMVPLARQGTEQRHFRAMAYLLDPTHDPETTDDAAADQHAEER